MADATVTQLPSPKPETKRADELAAGDWVMHDGFSSLIRYAEGDADRVQIVLRRAADNTLQSYRLYARYELKMLDDEEIDWALAEARRYAMAQQFRALADLVLKPTTPLPVHRPVRVDWDLDHASAAVEALAGLLGEQVVPVNTQVSVYRYGDTDFGPGVTTEWHAFRTEPKVPFDGTGFDYSRTADDPQPAGHREPMHTGAVTESGLVDESESQPQQPFHLAAESMRTFCGIPIMDLPTGVGWTNDHGAVTCQACIAEVPF